AALGERYTPPAPARTPPPGLPPTQAAARFGEALRADPWLDSHPVTLARVIPTPDGDTWQLADADDDFALPIASSLLSRPGLWRLAALSGGAPVTVFGECGHRGFTPLTAWPEGIGEPVSQC
ncbi:SWIM zinc finger family protein, partial [Streptomyces sp. NPDC127044]